MGCGARRPFRRRRVKRRRRLTRQQRELRAVQRDRDRQLALLVHQPIQLGQSGHRVGTRQPGRHDRPRGVGVLGDVDRVPSRQQPVGQRRSEVSHASAVELTDDAWSLPAARTKNSLPHMVPLTPYARTLFGSGFDIYPTTLSHRVRDVVRDLGIEDFRLHDLRHQAATGMAALGIRQDIRDRVLNQVTGRRQTVLN